MRILVTNDDGIHRPGLLMLVRELVGATHDVRVLAPREERSGSSSSLGTVVHGAHVPTEPITLESLSVVAHQVAAPPALAVRAVCSGAFGWLPQLVVSGINPGFNTGRLILHSGTVGAALTAASHDISGIAVSTEDESLHGLTSAATMATWLAGLVAEFPHPPLTFNLNVPARPLEELAGVQSASLSEACISDVVFEVDLGGLRVRRSEHEPPFEHGTDADVLSRGFAALSTICPPWTRTPNASSLAAALNHRWIGEIETTRAVHVANQPNAGDQDVGPTSTIRF